MQSIEHSMVRSVINMEPIPRHAPIGLKLFVLSIVICTTMFSIRMNAEENQFYLKRSLCNTFGGCSPAFSRSLPADRLDFKYVRGPQTRQRASGHINEAPYELADDRPLPNLRLPPARVGRFLGEGTTEYRYIDRHPRVYIRE